MSSPTQNHLQAAKRILRYIRGTLHFGIAFTPGFPSLSAYCDADWAGDPVDRSPFLVLLYSLAIAPSLGQLRSNPLSPDHPLKLSIEP